MSETLLNEHLVISVVIDNSYVAKSQTFCEGLKAFTEDLQHFYQSHPHKERFHLSVTTFGGLQPDSLKSFEEETFKPLDCHGFPLLNRAVEQSLDDLMNQMKKLKSTNAPTYKPWLIILSSGVSYEALELLNEDSVLQKMSQTTLFPFLLDDKFLANQVTAMNRIKPFMAVKDHQINALSEWLKMMLNQRLNDPSDVKMRLDKDMLKDWIYL